MFAHLNRVRATLVTAQATLLSREGKAEFGAQFKLLGQSVTSAIALADTPEHCDEQLSRLMVQLEELEGRFGEFDEFLGELASKREEVYEAFEAKKQQLLDERQRRAQNIATAAERILESVNRRAKSFGEDDELNAYFASDAMVLKLRELVGQLVELGDTVKADEIESRLKSAKQDASADLRDKLDLYDDGESVIKLGQHRFNVNTQPLELTLVPRDGAMYLHLTGTQYYEKIDDPRFEAGRALWDQKLVSETDAVYRGEYLASSMMRDLGSRRASRAASCSRPFEGTRPTATTRATSAASTTPTRPRSWTSCWRRCATARAASLRPEPRAWACLFWAYLDDADRKALWQRRARSLGRLAAILRPPARRGDPRRRALGCDRGLPGGARDRAPDRHATPGRAVPGRGADRGPSFVHQGATRSSSATPCSSTSRWRARSGCSRRTSRLSSGAFPRSCPSPSPTSRRCSRAARARSRRWRPR